MSCPSCEQLAMAVAGEAPDLDAHVAECARCAREVELQLQLVAHARSIVVPPLSRPRRMALAAETLARAEADRHRGARITVTVGLALAAGIALVLALPSLRDRDVVTALPTPPLTCSVDDEPAPRPPVDVPVDVPPAPEPMPPTTPLPVAPRPAALATSDGAIERARVRGRDTITLHDGTLFVDARERAPVSVIAGDLTLAVADSRVKLVVVDNVAVAVHVVAGAAAEVSAASGTEKVAAGGTWSPPATPAMSLSMFQAGWKALRDERYGVAIEAFDVARDPVVAEDAAYWAAVAASRAGRDHEARTRFEAFLTAFPDSTRADAAKAALAAIDP